MRGGTRNSWTNTAAFLLTGLSAFQIGLASGRPWGRIAYGGQHAGRLPENFRVASAVASGTYAGTAAFLLSNTGSPEARRRVLTGTTGLMAVGAAMNLASRSKYERLIWTPFCALTAVASWRARRGLR